MRGKLQRKTAAQVKKECIDAIPSTWLDPLLSGPGKVFNGEKITHDTLVSLCNAIRNRLKKIKL